MTDRVGKLTVVLKEKIRVDDVEALVNAISLLNGVAHVELGEADDLSIESLVEMRYKSSLMVQLHEFSKNFKID